MFKLLYFIILITSATKFIACAMEPIVVGGKEAKISDFPYSVFVTIKRINDGSYSCGASILNQKILLTAAHCISECVESDSITIYVGHSVKRKGKVHEVDSYIVHGKYDGNTVLNDIALLRASTELKFNENVKRVSIVKNPPYNEKAYIAGWGKIDEKRKVRNENLIYVKQYILNSNECVRAVGPKSTKGVICAASGDIDSYAAKGDSGSALVVRNYIQIGIVSYKLPSSPTVVMYTDVGYFYKWITEKSEILYCA